MKVSVALLIAIVALSLPLPAALAADTLLSGFEGDLSTTLGPSWQSNLPRSFVATGVTEGVNALQLTHGTGWTQDFFLDGGPALANLVAATDVFQIDTTTPATASWRQMFVIMQGANQGWSQHQFDLTQSATSTVTLDLNTTGIKGNALAGDKSWWQIYLIFQGGVDPATPSIQTTLDNVRFHAIPEPTSIILLPMVGLAWYALRRRV